MASSAGVVSARNLGSWSHVTPGGCAGSRRSAWRPHAVDSEGQGRRALGKQGCGWGDRATGAALQPLTWGCGLRRAAHGGAGTVGATGARLSSWRGWRRAASATAARSRGAASALVLERCARRARHAGGARWAGRAPRARARIGCWSQDSFCGMCLGLRLSR